MNELPNEEPRELEFVKLNQLEPARKTFFYEKPDGEVFACYEHEAALFGKFHKLLGVSDGKTYRDYVRNSGVKRGEMISIEKAREILKGAFEAEFQAAKGKFERPVLDNVHFDSSFPVEQRSTFIPPK